MFVTLQRTTRPIHDRLVYHAPFPGNSPRTFVHSVLERLDKLAGLLGFPLGGSKFGVEDLDLVRMDRKTSFKTQRVGTSNPLAECGGIVVHRD